MQSHFAQLVDVEARLCDAVRELRVQQSLVPAVDSLQSHAALTMLLANGLRVYCWLEDQHNGLLERIGEEYPLPRN